MFLLVAAWQYDGCVGTSAFDPPIVRSSLLLLSLLLPPLLLTVSAAALLQLLDSIMAATIDNMLVLTLNLSRLHLLHKKVLRALCSPFFARESHELKIRLLLIMMMVILRMVLLVTLIAILSKC